jgi:hypothetical protein
MQLEAAYKMNSIAVRGLQLQQLGNLFVNSCINLCTRVQRSNVKEAIVLLIDNATAVPTLL